MTKDLLIMPDLPIYTVKLPSNGKEAKFHPFTVKQEKLLLMAVESNSAKDIIETTKQVVTNCLLSKDVIVEKLPFFDLDYLFIAMRAKSVGETITISFRCNNTNEAGDECGGKFDASLDITNIKVNGLRQDHKVSLSGATMVKMKYPTYAVMRQLDGENLELAKKIKIISNSIDYIQIKDKVHTTKDLTPGEITNFIENLTQDQFKKMEEYVDNFPEFVVTSKQKCGKCGYEHNIEYSDFTRFFT